MALAAPPRRSANKELPAEPVVQRQCAKHGARIRIASGSTDCSANCCPELDNLPQGRRVAVHDLPF
jgi:hypothetical protein